MDSSKLDYFFTETDPETEDELFRIVNQQYTDLRKVDYYVDEDCKIPISFTQIQNVEQGILWYEYYHPEIPDDIIPMLARFQFGNLPPKHTRHTKKKKQITNILTFENKSTTINFND